MLPESDWPRLCDPAGGLREACRDSAFGVDVTSLVVSCDAISKFERTDFSQGCGDTRLSAGADTGVASVDEVKAVVADLGVTVEREPEIGVNGVKGVRFLGESSALGARLAESCSVVLCLSRVIDIFLASWGRELGCLGITRGARSLGDSGCLNP